MPIEPQRDLDSFFSGELMRAQQVVGVNLPDEVELYLAQLLARGTGKSLATGDRPLVLRLASALEAGERHEQLRRYREAGDAALYTAGFFSEHLEGRGLTMGYVAALGGRAYRGAEQLSLGQRVLFHELADGFRECVRVLDEVREGTTLRTPQDIVRLYDKWRRTRSPEVAARLHRVGVFPTVPKPELH